MHFQVSALTLSGPPAVRLPHAVLSDRASVTPVITYIPDGRRFAPGVYVMRIRPARRWEMRQLRGVFAVQR